MAKGRKSGDEAFSVGPIELEGTAGGGLIAFWQELASADVEGVGRVTVGNSAMGGLSLFVFLPHKAGVGREEHPPTSFTLDLRPLAQAMIGAAVARYQSGEPAVWHDVAGDMAEEEISAELDSLEKTPAKPGSVADRIRGERIDELRAEVRRRAGAAA